MQPTLQCSPKLEGFLLPLFPTSDGDRGKGGPGDMQGGRGNLMDYDGPGGMFRGGHGGERGGFCGGLIGGKPPLSPPQPPMGPKGIPKTFWVP